MGHVEHIVEFKEDLRVLLIGTLFILLAARLKLEDIPSWGHSTLFLCYIDRGRSATKCLVSDAGRWFELVPAHLSLVDGASRYCRRRGCLCLGTAT